MSEELSSWIASCSFMLSLLAGLACFDCSRGSTIELEIIKSSSLSDEAKLVKLALERLLLFPIPSDVISPFDWITARPRVVLSGDLVERWSPLLPMNCTALLRFGDF